MPKTWEKRFYKNIRVVCGENRSKKHQIFQKLDDFENRPSCKGYSSCTGYRLCKMVSLGQKLKMPETCEKPFYKNIRVVLCKKTARKNTKYSRNDTILEIGYLAKAIAHAKAIAFAKWSVYVKNLKSQKHAKKRFYKSIRVVLWKKPFEKTPNIREMRRF